MPIFSILQRVLSMKWVFSVLRKQKLISIEKRSYFPDVSVV